MKKVFAVMMAAATIAMVGCKKDDNGAAPIKPTVPEVEPTEGAYTVVWNAVDYCDCADLVFAGNYNYTFNEEGEQVWHTEMDKLVKFEKIEGYKNWYKAVIFDESEGGIDHLEGKPNAVPGDEFSGSWDYQWIGSEEHPCEIVKGDGEFVVEYSTETKLIVPAPGEVVYIRSYQFKVDPCVEEILYDITFNLEVEAAVPAENKVTIIGNFPGAAWVTGENALEMERVDDTHFTIQIKDCALGKAYKYAVDGTWDHEMYLFAPEEGDTCVAKASSDLTISNDEVNDKIAGFLGITTGEEIKGFCKEEEEPAPAPVDVEVHAGDVLTITATVAEELNLTEGLFLYSWGHEGDACLPMTESGDHEWTVSYTVTEGDVAGWKETGMLFVDVMINGDADWARKGGQTGDLKPMRSGNFQIAADWKVTEVTDEPAEEGGEEGGEEA